LPCRFVLHRAAEIHLLGRPAKQASKKNLHIVIKKEMKEEIVGLYAHSADYRQQYLSGRS
jgi:hypothetical protein